MPRVLRIINRLNIGGPTFNAAYLTKYMTGYDTMLLAGMIDETEGSSEHVLDKLDIQARYITHMQREVSPAKDRKGYLEIRKIIKDFKPDIVHTHAAKAGVLGRLAAMHCHVPVILHTFHGHVFHSYFSPLKTRIFIEIERYLARHTSGIIAISQKQKDELCGEFKIAKKENAYIIPNGFDLSPFTTDQERKREAFRQKYKVADDEIAIGIIGRLVPIKNHPLFLNAFAKVIVQADKKVKAFLVGDGEDRETILAHCRQLGLAVGLDESTYQEANVVFTSWITEVDRVNAGMDIIALTSNNEGTPVSLVEAGAAARPIVSTDVGGVRDTMLANETGLLSPARDTDALGANLLTLVHDSKLRESMGDKGRDFALAKYNYQRLVNDMDKLYTSLLKTEKNKGI